MAGKKKTTFAKLARERKLQERRLEKQARKEARKLADTQPVEPGETSVHDEDVARAVEAAHARD